MIALRERYSDVMIELFKQATVTGEPINRPIWWIDPYDVEAFNIEDGNAILNNFFKKHLQSSLFFQNFFLATKFWWRQCK